MISDFSLYSFKIDGNKNLVVTQTKVHKAAAGESVTTTCSFVTSYPSYTVRWTLGCDNRVYLSDQPYYKHRIRVSSLESNQTKHGLGMSEVQTSITIANLTENDSGTFCCHVELARGEKGTGDGTRLEVTPRSYTEDPNRRLEMEKEIFILYIIAGIEAFLIVILFAAVIKYRLQGSPGSEDKDNEEELEPELRLHYAEICKTRQARRPRDRQTENKVTYAPVRTRQ
ncbi:uncharacterized protein LOC142101484 [Mixophyes fleayi]|uniref:uncharacterized protein LOC142101484 n=1 Tax=Mixophyes fleayi TaxID=3061075 RepID=UPI003F4E2E1C